MRDEPTKSDRPLPSIPAFLRRMSLVWFPPSLRQTHATNFADSSRPRTRRDWLRIAVAACILPQTARADEPGEIAAIGQKVGLGPFGRTETAHFLGLGDATGEFRAEALNACEKMAVDFLEDLKAKGFAGLDFPKRRMSVVILADAKSYAAYTGEKPDLAIGGHFELDTNRLVMFDFRSNQSKVGAAAERINSFILFHETSHQLTFNIGVLSLKADVPLCISEGLATYGEVWRPKGRGRVGQVNKNRLDGLPGTARRLREAWLPLPRLLVEDDLLSDEKTRQIAYAESWILIHSHLKNPAKRPHLHTYLAAIAQRRDPKNRLADATKHLGDLDKLDAAMRAYARRPIGP